MWWKIIFRNQMTVIGFKNLRFYFMMMILFIRSKSKINMMRSDKKVKVMNLIANFKRIIP